MRGVLGHSTQQAAYALPDVCLWMIETGKKLGDDPWWDHNEKKEAAITSDDLNLDLEYWNFLIIAVGWALKTKVFGKIIHSWRAFQMVYLSRVL